MGKLFRNVLLIFLGAVFLLSFTGLRLLLHSCMGCSTSEMHLFAVDEGCCAAFEQDLAVDFLCSVDTKTISCCSDVMPEADCSNCCEDKVVYLINDYELLNKKSEVHIGSQLLVRIIANAELMNFDPRQIHASFPVNYYPPPPAYVGRDFILFSHQIKIG